MLIEQIKKDHMQAMKSGDYLAKGILSIVITKYNNLEIENRSKNRETTDADLYVVIQKTLKELNDELADFLILGKQAKVVEIKAQKDAIEKYLPKQLSEADVKQIIKEQNLTSIPDIMKYFKANHTGQVEMSLVSKVAREL